MSILHLETLEKFNYLIETLKPNSERLVVWQCEDCLLLKDKKFRTAKLNKLCLICSNKKNANTNIEQRTEKIKEFWKENGHSRLGKLHTEDSKSKMSKARKGLSLNLSEEKIKYLSENSTGEKNNFYGKKHTKESLLKISEAAKTNVRRGKDSNFYGKQYHGRGDRYKGIWMRSSWEIKFAEYLDSNNIEWSYEHKRFPITYIYNNEVKEGTYCPDFYIVKENYFIEIKGYWRDDAKEKFESFKNTYTEIKIDLYEKERLKKLGII